MHSLAVSLKSLQTQFKQLNKLQSLSDTSLSSLDAFFPQEHFLAWTDTVLLQQCLFPGKVELNDDTQYGAGVIARFLSKDFIWLGSALGAETLVSAPSLY